MKAYLAHILINVKLTLRDRVVLFFNYAFPLAFFFIFAQSMHAERGGAITQVAAMVLIIGVLGNGFFGAGIRAVLDRELNILRRFKVAPISPAPILVASLVTGWLHYLPSALLILGLSHFVYGMPVPERWLSLTVLLSIGILAFRAVGLIIASVVNSLQESQIIIQLFYLPMLLLSGATFPLNMLPTWLQLVAQFLPATYIYTGLQGILVRQESLAENAKAGCALLITTLLSLLLAAKLFRWEKGEKVRASAKAWLVAVLMPFILLGVWQAWSRENVTKAKLLYREMRRSRTILIRNARIFTGDGRVIDSGAVLVRDGKIAEVFEGYSPDAKTLKAEDIEAAGKTLLPGLIDAHVHLATNGGLLEHPAQSPAEGSIPRALAAYLYSGVTTVRSAGDPPVWLARARALIASGERLGAELYYSGPMFTAPGGRSAEYVVALPENLRHAAGPEIAWTPQGAAAARWQVAELAEEGVDAIQAVLDSGPPGAPLPRMEPVTLRAIAAEALARRLPLGVDTGESRDVAEALAAGAASIEHGSFRDRIPAALFAAMARARVAYIPSLAVAEASEDAAAGRTGLLERSVVQQVGPAPLIAAMRRVIQAGLARGAPLRLEQGRVNLLAALAAGVTLVAGSDAGNLLVLHGPGVHRELLLWVRSGVPPREALRAATLNAARLLGQENRIGLIRKGADANLLLVDGNPLEDITATERISAVIFQGERVERPELFDEE